MMASEGARRRQGRARSDRFDTTAMTTGSVPISMVGIGTPAVWMAADRKT